MGEGHGQEQDAGADYCPKCGSRVRIGTGAASQCESCGLVFRTRHAGSATGGAGPVVQEGGAAKCPMCAEAVQPDALICRHCGTDFRAPAPTAIQPHVGTKPDNHLVGAVVATLLCCLPLGVVAIVYAVQVDNLWRSGDYEGARRASQTARRWENAAQAIGFVVIGGYIIISVITALS